MMMMTAVSGVMMSGVVLQSIRGVLGPSTWPKTTTSVCVTVVTRCAKDVSCVTFQTQKYYWLHIFSTQPLGFRLL
jgi:hypothetical protein